MLELKNERVYGPYNTTTPVDKIILYAHPDCEFESLFSSDGVPSQVYVPSIYSFVKRGQFCAIRTGLIFPNRDLPLKMIDCELIPSSYVKMLHLKCIGILYTQDNEIVVKMEYNPRHFSLTGVQIKDMDLLGELHFKPKQGFSFPVNVSARPLKRKQIL
jgi:hypothetical protein